MSNEMQGSHGPGTPKSPSSLTKRLTWITLVLLVLYPLAEFFVWTPLMMKIYCPKRDSDAPSAEQKLNPYSDAKVLLSIENIEEPKGLPAIILSLIESVDEIIVPLPRIGPPELREYIRSVGGANKFVAFSTTAVSSEECAAQSERFMEFVERLPPPERQLTIDVLEKARGQGKCVGASFTNVIDPDFVYLLRDSTIATAAGTFSLREAIEIPLGALPGKLSRHESGRLDPTLPVTRFVSRSISNGYLSCSLQSK